MKKIFNDINITWKKLIIFAICVAIYTALINEIHIFRNTSLQDIAINLEAWLLFALIIVGNSKNSKDAAIKCFVFFLISQPLIYLIEAPFEDLGLGIFMYYRYWAVATILTIPAAIVAYQLKRKNWFSVLILSIANVYLIIQAITYLKSSINGFPHHLLSFIFCVLLAFVLVFVFFDSNTHRYVSIAIIVISAIVYMLVGGFKTKAMTYDIYVEDGISKVNVDNKDVIEYKQEGEHLYITPIKDGMAEIIIENNKEEQLTYYATVNGLDIFVNELTE